MRKIHQLNLHNSENISKIKSASLKWHQQDMG